MRAERLLAAFLFVVSAVFPAAAVPPGFSVQGRLTDANGVNRVGQYSLKFTIHDAAEAGTSKWTRTYDAVTVRNGQFSVTLGDTAGQPPLAQVFAEDARFLEIQVLSGPGIASPEPPLAPRQQLVSVPYAVRSAVADEVTNSPMPAGAILMFLSATCPPGFSEVTGLRNRFPVGADPDSVDAEIPPAAGTSGGGGGHSHGIFRNNYSGNSSGGPIFNAVTTILETVPPRPPFLTVLFCAKQ